MAANSFPKKRNYSSLSLRDAMRLVPAEEFTFWDFTPPPRAPSAFLPEAFRRLDVFDTETTEQAKTLIMDALFAEVVSLFPRLKVWKAALIETDTLSGVADYLITPRRAYVATPLLCVTEAKRDDFVQGRAQCVAEMFTCRENNTRDGFARNVWGIVSNGQSWQFYQLTLSSVIYESKQFSVEHLPELIGALYYVCQQCADVTDFE